MSWDASPTIAPSSLTKVLSLLEQNNMLEDFDEGAAVLCAFVSLFMNKSTRIMTNTGRKGESYIDKSAEDMKQTLG